MMWQGSGAAGQHTGCQRRREQMRGKASNGTKHTCIFADRNKAIAAYCMCISKRRRRRGWRRQGPTCQHAEDGMEGSLSVVKEG